MDKDTSPSISSNQSKKRKYSYLRSDHTNAFNIKKLITHRKTVAGDMWGNMDTDQMSAEIEHALLNGCPCCKSLMTWGSRGSYNKSPSIDRINPLYPCATTPDGKRNWVIICMFCNTRKNDSTIEESAVLLSGIRRVAAARAIILDNASSLSTVSSGIPSAGRSLHMRSKCNECIAGGCWCATCKVHILPENLSKHNRCLLCERNHKRSVRKGEVVKGTRQKSHVCSDQCTNKDLPFCMFYYHLDHVEDATHMSTKRNAGNKICYSCVRLISSYTNMITRARKHSKPFDASAEFKTWLFERIKTANTCAYCQCALDHSKGPRGIDISNSPSIDCFIASRGYTRDNIEICCFLCNRRKSNASLEEMETLHAWRVQYNQQI